MCRYGLQERALCFSLGLYVDETTPFFALAEYHCAVNKCVQSVVLAHAYVEARVVHCAALTFDDVACFGVLTAKNLHSESFAFRLTAVLRTTNTFLMCHFYLRFLGLCNYVFDHDLREILAMAVETTVVVAAFLLEDNHLVAFYEWTFYLANYFGSLYGGCAYLNGTVGVYEQNAVEYNLFALFFLVAEIVYIQELSGFCLELLSLDFYNCVHLKCMIFKKLCPQAGVSAACSGACFS